MTRHYNTSRQELESIPSTRILYRRVMMGALEASILALTLSSCTRPDHISTLIPEAYPVEVSHHALIGLDRTDIRMCAGFPTATYNGGSQSKIWTYVRESQRGGVRVNLPTVGVGLLAGTAGAVSLTGGANCSMQIRFEKGRVVQVSFSGDSNSVTRLDAYCVPLVDSCDRYAERLRPLLRKQTLPSCSHRRK